jgi:26S proteasome regulatory subunit N10
MRELTEEEEMELALQMSMTNEQTSGVDSRVTEDAQFMSSVLSSLPGVDPNDQTLQNLLANIKKDEEKKEDKKQ